MLSLARVEWHPYSPFTFVTPPFPGYPSGHSTVSGACSKALELFTGTDSFSHAENRIAGALTEAGYDYATIMAMEGKPFSSQVRCDVELPMPTFSATADMAGLSRILGGYHIAADNVEGLKLGRTISTFEWPRILATSTERRRWSLEVTSTDQGPPVPSDPFSGYLPLMTTGRFVTVTEPLVLTTRTAPLVTTPFGTTKRPVPTGDAVVAVEVVVVDAAVTPTLDNGGLDARVGPGVAADVSAGVNAAAFAAVAPAANWPGVAVIAAVVGVAV